MEHEIIELAETTVMEALDGDFKGERLSGMNGSYVQLTEKWDVKFSRHDDMSKSFAWQQAAAEHGLGPDCFGFFIYNCKRGFSWGCYVTENAEIVCDPSEGDYFEDEDMQREADELAKELSKKIGFSFFDNHSGNVAYLNGRMVCIDFGGNE